MSKKQKGITLYTKMLKRKVRVLIEPYTARAGVVMNVYLIPAGLHYTVMLHDGRLIECQGQQMIVER